MCGRLVSKYLRLHFICEQADCYFKYFLTLGADALHVKPLFYPYALKNYSRSFKSTRKKNLRGRVREQRVPLHISSAISEIVAKLAWKAEQNIP